jgi:xylulokinase
MSTSPLFMGIDVSTTNAKVLLIDDKGTVVASTAAEHPVFNPQPLWSEQDPHDWWEGVSKSIRQALVEAGANGSQVSAVGLTGQMHGLVLLDAAGQVLRPAILWNDQRTAVECEEIEQRVGSQRLLEITGNRALTGFTAPKILWVRKHEPEIYEKIAHILLPKDYIRFRLTGDFAVDKADGSGMLLFDLQARNWSEAVLDALEIPAEWLPETVEGPQISGLISSEAARLTGLKEGTPVVGGGGDQPAQAVGVGAVNPGIIALTLGTSGVVFAPTQAPFVEPEVACTLSAIRFQIAGA